MPQPLLAIDSAGAACSAAVWRDGSLAAERLETMQRGQSERLLPLIETAMAEAGVAYGELAAIAVTTGPGGFTGPRIGLAAARGLALAAGVPAIGVGSFVAHAAAVPETERAARRLWVALDSRRDEIYLQAFESDLGEDGEPQILLPEEVAPRLGGEAILLTGDAAERTAELLEGSGDARIATTAGPARAAAVAGLVAGWPVPPADAPPPRPVYLRPPDVTLPRSKGGGR
jgi:tRNA threonylcarbamoyladenosine biosynthesis protein TsaB